MARKSWLDESSQSPLIDKYARELEGFVAAMADGRVEAHELAAQEARVVACMKEVEPLLDDRQHERVTQLLCELSAYNIMQMLSSLVESRPQSKFRG